jgi:hypothetical protein
VIEPVVAAGEADVVAGEHGPADLNRLLEMSRRTRSAGYSMPKPWCSTSYQAAPMPRTAPVTLTSPASHASALSARPKLHLNGDPERGRAFALPSRPQGLLPQANALRSQCTLTRLILLERLSQRAHEETGFLRAGNNVSFPVSAVVSQIFLNSGSLQIGDEI